MAVLSLRVEMSWQQRSIRTAQLFDELASCAADESAGLIEEVVLINRRVSHAVARRYRNRGMPLDDLFQAADEGLVKAAQKFDPTLRNDFLSYAVPTIRGEVQRHFRDRGWTVRPPRRIQELQLRANRTSDALTRDLGRPPTQTELVDEMGIEHDEYAEAMAAYGCFQPTSLDEPILGRPGGTLGSLVAAEPTHEVETRLLLASVVRQLSERDRRILYLRFFEDRTQSEIGELLGVTQMQVSRLLTRILANLRNDLDPV